MRFFRLLLIALGVTGYFLVVSLQPPLAQAALSQVQIRPSRSKSATAPGTILVIAQTTDFGVEDEVEVQVGDSWSISATPGSFTTSTSGLPSGVTPWPGIGTATAVSGNTISFPSSDLTADTAYGFFITSGIPSNPAAGSGWEYAWTLTTLAASTTLSTTTIGVPVVANDQIVITAEIEPPATEFDAQLETVEPLETLTANEEVEYEITYGSDYAQSTTLTVQAEWTLGTITGNASPTVDIAEYVLGSATDAYNNTAPVIDLENQTITWEISNYPAELSGQTVRFKLKTTSVNNSQQITFDVKARIIEPTATGYSTVNHTYYYSPPPPSPVPSPSAGSTPSTATSPTPTPSATPTPVPAVTAPSITAIELQTIGTTTATIGVGTNPASNIVVRYGVSPTSLSQSISSVSPSLNHNLTLADLAPATTYYFQIETIGNLDETVSDLFVFTTAIQEPEVVFETNSLVVSTSGIHLATDREVANPFITIASEVDHEVTFRLDRTQTLQSVSLIFQPLSVLGATTLEDQSSASAREFMAVETSPGVYSVKLNDELALGNYEIRVRMKDFYGNISEKQLARLAVVPPLTVIDTQTQKGIHDAQVLFTQYNPSTKLYEQVIPGSQLASNPMNSTAQGFILASLPPGKYRAQVSAIGYHSQEIEFEITLTSPSNYPLVKLEPAPFQIGSYLQNLRETARDFMTHTVEFVGPWSVSSRFFSLISTITLTTFAFLSFLAFSLRSQLPFRNFKSYLHTHLFLLFAQRQQHQQQIINGQIHDCSGSPVSQAIINIIDPATQAVISQTITNQKGYFHVLTSLLPVEYRVTKAGCQDVTGTFSLDDTQQEVQLILNVPDTPTHVLEHVVLRMLKRVLSFFFEFLILGSLGLEILFTFTHGWWATLPFIILTFINLGLWQVYLHSHRLR